MDYMYANRMGLMRSDTDVFLSFCMRVPNTDGEGNIDGERDVDERNVILTVDAARALQKMLADILSVENVENAQG